MLNLARACLQNASVLVGRIVYLSDTAKLNDVFDTHYNEPCEALCDALYSWVGRTDATAEGHDWLATKNNA